MLLTVPAPPPADGGALTAEAERIKLVPDRAEAKNAALQLALRYAPLCAPRALDEARADADAAAGGAGAGQWFPLTVGEACQLLGAFKDGARAADIAASALAAGWQADPGARHAAGEPFQPLRAGWKAKWSRDYCCWYFEETGTGASSWERPTDGDAAR